MLPERLTMSYVCYALGDYGLSKERRVDKRKKKHKVGNKMVERKGKNNEEFGEEENENSSKVLTVANNALSSAHTMRCMFLTMFREL